MVTSALCLPMSAAPELPSHVGPAHARSASKAVTQAARMAQGTHRNVQARARWRPCARRCRPRRPNAPPRGAPTVWDESGVPPVAPVQCPAASLSRRVLSSSPVPAAHHAPHPIRAIRRVRRHPCRMAAPSAPAKRWRGSVLYRPLITSWKQAIGAGWSSRPNTPATAIP